MLFLAGCFSGESVPVAVPDGPQFPPNPPQVKRASLCPFASWNGDTLEVIIKLENWYGDGDAIGWDMYYEGLTYESTTRLSALSDWTVFGGWTNTTTVLSGNLWYPTFTLAQASGFTLEDQLSPEGELTPLALVKFTEAPGNNFLTMATMLDNFYKIPIGCSWAQ